MKHNFGYFFREGARNMLSHGFMSFAAVTSTVACLLIMGTFSLIAYNAAMNLETLQKENAVVGFVDEDMSMAQAQALEDTIKKIDGAGEVTFISRQEARDEYVEKYDTDDLYESLDASVFRHRYMVKLADPEKLPAVKHDLEEVPGIVKVRADEMIAAGFTTVRNVAAVISVALIGILLIVSLFIISNTIKLTTFDRRDEIAIERMVGATNAFIRWPFVFEGLLLGLLGAVIAFALQWGLYALLARGIAGSDTLRLISVVSFGKIWGPVAGVFAVAGLIIGVLGSLMAIRRFLKV